MSYNLLIYKDNRIIEASYRLTLREQRLVLLCISQINALEKLNENKVFTITANEYSQVFGGDPKNAFRDMKEAMDLLFDRFIKVIVSDNRREEFRWISKKSTILSNQSVEIRFTADIAPYLHNLKGNFTKYHFLHVRTMTSVFSIRIYEMLMQWKTKRTLTLSLDQLRDRLQINNKYTAFANIKQKIIEPAVTEINACTDILVSYDLRKAGRKVSDIVFSFQFKPGMEPKLNAKINPKTLLKALKKNLQ